MTYVTDILELKDDFDSIIPQLMMLAFVDISVWVGFFPKNGLDNYYSDYH